ncbi:hypothetical protein GCM10023333_35050 [Ferrimonas pelagia]|uniref:Uncharacterized protein n=1 Tax=Ferrimonas pelagia TaxID=1177826 RepID=A0ABP9FIK1_9GAMM
MLFDVNQTDGKVEIAYTLGVLEVPLIEEGQDHALAAQQCLDWGYQTAEPFKITERRCQRFSSDGSCSTQLIIRRYQCHK